MPKIEDIDVPSLLLDRRNPRFEEEPASQQAAARELAAKHGAHILRLAHDIVENGVDPLTLPAVVASSDQKKRYTVIEGNRRLLTIKALETPTLISSVLSPAHSRKLTELSKKYARNPIASLNCVLFDSEDEARHWIFLRHTGQNDGAGLVTWGSAEKDRFQARYSGKRKPAGQVMDFVEKHGALSPEARASRKGVLTNVERLIETTDVRKTLGIDLVDGDVISLYPLEEVIKGLTRIVEDLKTEEVSVPQLYHAEQRKAYVAGFGRKSLPKKSTALKQPVVLSDLTSGRAKPRTVTSKAAASKSASKASASKQRTTVLEKSTQLNIAAPRINAIYNELLTLNAESFPNACSVLLRVFVELSVDHYISDNQLMTEQQVRNAPLAKRLKEATADLKKEGKVTASQKTALDNVANGPSMLAPGVHSFNQYVHNQFVFPKATELYAAADELTPLLSKIWS